jgi:hypothetical protein
MLLFEKLTHLCRNIHRRYLVTHGEQFFRQIACSRSKIQCPFTVVDYEVACFLEGSCYPFLFVFAVDFGVEELVVGDFNFMYGSVGFMYLLAQRLRVRHVSFTFTLQLGSHRLADTYRFCVKPAILQRSKQLAFLGLAEILT